MKKILHILLFIITYNISAQIPCPEDEAYSDFAYRVLRPLDKTQIPTGVLYENVFPLAAVDNYTGQSNADTSSTAHFLQAYAELYLSHLNNTGRKHYFDVYDQIAGFSSNPQFYHPIGLLDYAYNSIDPQAVNDNLLSVSGQQLFDVAGRPRSPYLHQNARIAAALMAEEYPCLYPGQHYFTFDDAFVLANTGFSLAQVSHLKASYNNAVIFNSPVNGLQGYSLPLTVGNADQSSTLILILTVNGQQRHYYISLCQTEVQPTTACQGKYQIPITGYALDAGYGEGSYSEKGIATVYYSAESCQDRRIRRPIIFVDGFDPGNKQHHNHIWDKYLNDPFDEVNNINSRLGSELLANGYDIIILDQVEGGSDGKKYNRGGTGLIENNGLVLAKLLDELWVRYHDSMVEDFVVVGASMGGLVARYGLAWMETNNKPHHTRLFVSFDSPQNGAQMPLGLQQMVDNFTRFGGLAFFPSVRNSLHLSHAAKQMLLHHSETNSESVKAHASFTKLRQNLAAVGNYPGLCRKIAIINGNRVGSLKTLSPNPDNAPPIHDKDRLLDFGIHRKGFYWCNANVCKKLYTKVYSQTDDNRSLSNSFTVNSTNLLLLLSGSVPFPFFTKNRYVLAENGQSYDIAPGSRIKTDPLEKTEDGWIQTFTYIFGGAMKTPKNIIRFSNFVPTTSAAAYTFPNGESSNIYKNFTGINLSKCAGTTPFDTVYAPGQDMFHVSINEYVANAFRSEIYTPKPIGTCNACPDYIHLNTPIVNSISYKAGKAISLLPNFQAGPGQTFKASIGGCGNSAGGIIDEKPTKGNNTTAAICPFDWDGNKIEVVCNANGSTTFRVFVKNMTPDTYAEFAIGDNGGPAISWNRANIGDKGWEITLANIPFQSQKFYARPQNNPNNGLQGWLGYCN